MVNDPPFLGTIMLNGRFVFGFRKVSHIPHLIQHPCSVSTAEHVGSAIGRSRKTFLLLGFVVAMIINYLVAAAAAMATLLSLFGSGNGTTLSLRQQQRHDSLSSATSAAMAQLSLFGSSSGNGSTPVSLRQRQRHSCLSSAAAAAMAMATLLSSAAAAAMATLLSLFGSGNGTTLSLLQQQQRQFSLSAAAAAMARLSLFGIDDTRISSPLVEVAAVERAAVISFNVRSRISWWGISSWDSSWCSNPQTTLR
jgi:hypothetical protein